MRGEYEELFFNKIDNSWNFEPKCSLSIGLLSISVLHLEISLHWAGLEKYTKQRIIIFKINL